MQLRRPTKKERKIALFIGAWRLPATLKATQRAVGASNGKSTESFFSSHFYEKRTMKPPKKPLYNYIFNPSIAEYATKSSLETLVSHFLSPDSVPTQKSYLIPTQNFSSFYLNLQNIYTCSLLHEFASTRVPGSNQLNPSIKTNFNSSSFFSKHKKDEFVYTHFLDSVKKSKSLIKTTLFVPRLPGDFIQYRPFSATPTDPFSAPSNSTVPNSSYSVPIPVVSTVSLPAEASEPIDASSSIRKPSLWPGMYHSPVTNALWEARSNIFGRMSNVESNVPSQSVLIKKTPSMSRTSILYKFSSDYILREQYRNPWNKVRMGKLVEDLDALAGTISYKHCSNDNSTRPLLLVTASVDKMVLKKPIRVDIDLTMGGSVTWVGRSSMEIQLEVRQETSNDSDSLALVANFTFVARDSKTGKSALINQISPETEKERLLCEEAEERNKMRRQKKGEQKRGMDDKEIDRLNELLSEGRVFCDMPALADRDSILIADTCLQNSLICQPQQRNIHGRIFGGFLMRRAFELAFSTAYAFAGSQPLFVEVDHVDFLKPVDVGNFLHFKSCVLYTELENPEQPLINIEVVAHVTCPELRSSEVSNKFYFTFTVRSEAVRDGRQIRNVVPATEEEARRVIERMDAESS